MPALQVDIEEMPLELRRKQIMMIYWANLQGHNNHPTISANEPCREHGKRPTKSCGWVVKKKASEMGLPELHSACCSALIIASARDRS